MNISGASFTLSSDDIKSMIEDFLKVPGVSVTDINIDKYIRVSGNFKKLVKIPFKLTVSIVSINSQNVFLKLEKVEILKVPIFNWIKNVALKKAVKTLRDYGVTFNNEIVDMHIPILLATLPIKIKFSLKSVEVHKNSLDIEVEKILLDISNINTAVEKIRVGAVIPIKEKRLSNAKNLDLYDGARKNIEEKVSPKLKGILPYIMVMPDIIALFIRLFKDKRVPIKAKIICGSVIAYFALPIDVVPDFLPFIGKVDDFAIAFFALDKILCDVPKDIIIDNWQGKEDIILFIRSGVDYIYRVIGASNIGKGYKWFSNILKTKEVIGIPVEEKEKVADGKESICN